METHNVRGVLALSKDFNTIIQKDKNNLELAIELLMKDIVDANIYNNLLKSLKHDLKENENFYNESKTFWYLTIQANEESIMIRLCRIFDTEKNSISMINL
ncbi:MAG: hypothetical protein PF445_01390, partial [Melioribacteraceae bacterium]|nr:hypothetical protein [Melioribacteraceae bacterium]